MVMEGGSEIGVVMMRSTDDFFRDKMEECLELAKQAANEEDCASWERLAESWHERLRQLQGPLRRRRQKKGRAVRTAKQGGLGDNRKVKLCSDRLQTGAA
jgi:hypothetical protein